MAYKNLVSISCSDKRELFNRTRDYICARSGTYDYSSTGIGWTLHDSSYAINEDSTQVADWFVIYSSGESGREDLYFKVSWISNFIKIEGFQYWNSTTHVGVKQYNTVNNFSLSDTGSHTLSIWGDLDFLVIGESSNSTYDYLVYFGKVENSVYDDSIAISAASLSSGVDIVITLDSVPSTWTVGGKVFIRDNANINLATIKDITGSQITVDLTNSFAAGTKVQEALNYVCCSSATSLILTSMVSQASTSTGSISFSLLAITSISPDGFGNYLGVNIFLFGSSNFQGNIPNMTSLGLSLTPMDSIGPDSNGDYWRYFRHYSSTNLAIKEV